MWSARFGMPKIGGARLPKDRRTLPGLNMFRHRSTILGRQTRRAVPRMCHHLQRDRTIDQTARQRSGVAPRFCFWTRLCSAKTESCCRSLAPPTSRAGSSNADRQICYLLFAICHCRVAARPTIQTPLPLDRQSTFPVVPTKEAQMAGGYSPSQGPSAIQLKSLSSTVRSVSISSRSVKAVSAGASIPDGCVVSIFLREHF